MFDGLLITFNRADTHNSSDFGEKLGNIGLGLLRLGFGRIMLVKKSSKDSDKIIFKEQMYSTITKIVAVALFLFGFLLTIPLAAIGYLGATFSKSYSKMFNSYSQVAHNARREASEQTDLVPEQTDLVPERTSLVSEQRDRLEEELSDKAVIQQALDDICYPSFLSRLKAVYSAKKTDSNDEQQIWLSTVLELFLDAYIEEGCHPRLTWRGCLDFCYDSLPIEFGESVIYRQDCLNDQQHKVNALSFKRTLNALNEDEKAKLAVTCISSNDVELDLQEYECLTQLRAITFSIQGRYNKALNTNSADIKDLIYDKLKELFKASSSLIDADLEILLNPEFAFRICWLLIIDLLSNAEIQGEQLLIPPNICLNFSFIENPNSLERDHIAEISYCQVNDLNSKNGLDYPYITDHPLKLARFLKNDPSGYVEEAPEFECFEKWVEVNYYNPFCAQWAALLQPKHEVRQVVSKSESSSRRTIINDRFGDSFMLKVNEQFEVNFSWSLSGSCFLASLFPEYEKNSTEGYEKISELRALMSVKIAENFEKYLDYVMVIPGFFELGISEQERLKKEYWAIAEDELLSTKKKAVENRAEQVLDTKTYLMEPEFELAAQLIQCPIYLYKRLAGKFFLDTNSNLLPHVIYGEELSGAPRHLLDDYDHYKPLNPKNPSIQPR